MSTCRRGFTLVELLVVVAILALLVSLLMPTLAGAKESARQAYCLNNQSGIAKALNLYHGDCGSFPYNYADYAIAGRVNYSGTENVNGVTLTRNRWALMCLAQYLGGTKGVVAEVRDMQEGQYPGIYVCPSADLSAVYTGAPSDRYHACYWSNLAIRLNRGYPNGSMLLYGYPSGTADYDPGDNEITATATMAGGQSRIYGNCPRGAHWRTAYAPTLESIDDASAAVFTGDTRNTAATMGGVTSLAGTFLIAPGWGRQYYETRMGFDRHGGKLMLGYVDGHAAAMSQAEFDRIHAPYSSGEYPSGRFLLRFTRPCNPNGFHSLPAGAVE